MKREIKQRAFTARLWQQQAYRKVIGYYQAGIKDFLCVATPGAGKTKFALMVAHEFLLKKYVDRVIVITPTTNLKDQWARDSAEFAGIDIDPDISGSRLIETPEFYGSVLTYSLVGTTNANENSILKTSVDKTKTLAIFDEDHHTGDSLTWGDAVQNIFANATFRLSISGTAFRSDANPIPFVTYEKGVSKADYTYSYEQAIKDNVCRPVYFHSFDGVMKWEVEGEIFQHSFEDYLTPDQKSKRLRTALSEDGKYVYDVFNEAEKTLNSIRKTHADAGGLIFCTTQDHAKQIAKIVKKITGIAPQVIISDDPKSSEEINRFRESRDKWIVSVRMVSEGVDIPRLRVGVYLTNITKELFFRQAIGRFVRMLQNLTSQDAHIFIPMDPEILKLAEQISEEREHALEEQEKEEREQKSLFPEYTPALKGKFIPIGSRATGLKTISINVNITSGMKTRVIKEQPLYMEKMTIRESCNTIAIQVAKQMNNGGDKVDWHIAHRLWLQNGGLAIELETIDQLKKRKEFYRSLLQRN